MIAQIVRLPDISTSSVGMRYSYKFALVVEELGNLVISPTEDGIEIYNFSTNWANLYSTQGQVDIPDELLAMVFRYVRARDSLNELKGKFSALIGTKK